MVFEHFALNVPDARAMSEWYVKHLGFTVVRSREEAPYTRFLADESGRVVVELYSNLSARSLEFGTEHPLTFHFAVISRAADQDRSRLEQAGATFFVEDRLPDGTRLIMLRDPWGVPVQLCQRTHPFPDTHVNA
jgi:glyoxylase I family protein